MKQPPKTLRPTPEKFGKENNLYPDWQEKLWHVYEGDLLRVINDLSRNKIAGNDAEYLLLHVAALKPRGVAFIDDLNAYERSYGLSETSDLTKLAFERAGSFIATLQYALDWRWRVIYPARDEVFVLNDRGCCEFSEDDPKTGERWPGRGVFFPLNPSLGILGFRYEKRLHKTTYVFQPMDFSESYTLNSGYTNLLNLRLWEEAQRFVVGRPGDESLVNALGGAIGFPSLQPGPYSVWSHLMLDVSVPGDA